MPNNNKEIASKQYVNKIFRSAQYAKEAISLAYSNSFHCAVARTSGIMPIL